MGRPAIILTSKFSVPSSRKAFGRYVGYIARKEALEEKDELSRVKKQARKLNQENNFTRVKSEEHSEREAAAEKLMEKKNFFDLNDKEFDKYLGYMVKIRLF